MNIPPLGGKDFADRNTNEQNFLRAAGAALSQDIVLRSELPAAAAVADIATADATDLPTVIALANDTKAKINELLAALRLAGLLNT